ncbi:MAG TPA: chromosomal replication initiator protein DnaA [Candidatus Acidoferrum sp.]|jgi:chromosomal replication initiator protein|nr:chromosomal replication initiator protein DnaA [Candidatus Acidoferrum sp.]
MVEALWARLLAVLEGQVPESVLESWLRPCRLLAVDGNRLRIVAPNKFTRDWIGEHHVDTIQVAARTVLGGNPQVSIEMDAEPERSAPISRERIPGAALDDLTPRYTFGSFVIGSSNQFAQAACQAVAERPGKAYSPLFLYGGVGLGKTHLLHAVGHEMARLHPSLRLLYLSSERFTNELINAIRYDRTGEFRAKYRTIDLLLIDDIQFMAGKERTQEEFFHTFNDLYESHKQIVVSSDSTPKEIPELEERLRSRFEWGLIADIQPPDFETRVAILKKRAEIERVRLPDDVAYLMASRIKTNIREIEGSLTRMAAFCSLTGREMSVDVAQEVLSELWGADEKVITIEHIQRKVSEFFGLKLTDMRARRRTKAVAFPRQIAMYFARQLTHASLTEVGRAFDKDHTTVLHAVTKVETLIRQDAKFKKTVDTLAESVAR